MELVFIAFLGTFVLMAAELAEFVKRARTTPTARNVPELRPSLSTTEEDLYDQAA